MTSASIVEALSTAMSSDLSQDPSSQGIVLYHFCDFRHGRSTHAVNIIASLLRQVLEYDPKDGISPTDESFLWAKQQEGPLDDDNLVYELFGILSERQGPVCVVIDGLDECVDLETLLPILLRWAENKDMRILVASRDEQHIRQGLNASSSICLKPEFLQPDVECFIRDEVARLVLSKRLRTRNQDLPALIASALADKANGM